MEHTFSIERRRVNLSERLASKQLHSDAVPMYKTFVNGINLTIRDIFGKAKALVTPQEKININY